MKYSNTCRLCKSSNVITHGAVLSPFITYRILGILPVSVSKLYNLENGTNYFPCLTMGCKDCSFIGCNILFDNDEMMKNYQNYMLEEYLTERRRFEPDFTHSLWV